MGLFTPHKNLKQSDYAPMHLRNVVAHTEHVQKRKGLEVVVRQEQRSDEAFGGEVAEGGTSQR